MPEQRKMLVIGITSSIGAGKDFIADLLVKDYGFAKFAPGDVVREIIAKESKGKPLTRELQQEVQTKYKEKYGEDYIMQLLYEKALASGNDRIVFPGLRFKYDVEFFRKKFGDSFYELFVTAPKRLRYERMLKRGREDAPKSYKEFLEQDKRQEEWYGISQTRKLADFVLKNDCEGEAELKSKLEKMLEKMEKL